MRPTGFAIILLFTIAAIFGFATEHPISFTLILIFLIWVAFVKAGSSHEERELPKRKAPTIKQAAAPHKSKPNFNSGAGMVSLTRSNLSADLMTATRSIPDNILRMSGSAFYTGREAFTGTKKIYFLGLNPGGSPTAQTDATVGRHIDTFWSRTDSWSSYADESWEGAKPGTWGMQPRVLHMMRKLGLDPRGTPASNVIFVRSTTESTLKADKNLLLNACWPVHQTIIDSLGIRIVVCFGGTAGRWVREKLGATVLIDRFQENNARGWSSEAHQNRAGVIVATVTHPGRANWLNPDSDPTELIARCMAKFT